LVKGQHRIMALVNAAVHQEIDFGRLDKVAGAGDAVFGADVGDFHGVGLGIGDGIRLSALNQIHR
jgi:hypothetical protein